ncbi:PIG-L family deacetylase [Candidatus Gottesmanbacteria bacterium]|nr:PIG-L family deacetylase [Candidatus Gottesmanbacteria bacterium]
MRERRLLAVFAHPDDEAFGPAGAIAKYAHEGVEVHVLTATKGEKGEWQQEKIKNQSASWRTKIKSEEVIKITEKVKIEHVREKELLASAKILEVAKVEFLDFIDGTLCNAVYHKLANKVIQKINAFQPHVVITLDRLGVSGHLDHIAVSLTTTYAFQKTTFPKKLYYECLPQKIRKNDPVMDTYFIYFPEGFRDEEITTRIDYSAYWDKKVAAMRAHKSQSKDVGNILTRLSKWPKVDYFILQMHRGVPVKLPETDLFAGVKI